MRLRWILSTQNAYSGRGVEVLDNEVDRVEAGLRSQAKVRKMRTWARLGTVILKVRVLFQKGQGLFCVAGAIDRGVVGEDDLAGFVDDKCLTAGHKELARDTECFQDGVGGVDQKGIGQAVVLPELFVTVGGAIVDADDDRTGFDQVFVAVAEAAGFFCADHAFVFWIEEDDQVGFAKVVGAVEGFSVLVGQAKGWDDITDGEGFSVGALATGVGRQDQE
jgi:hypothetical protein